MISISDDIRFIRSLSLSVIYIIGVLKAFLNRAEICLLPFYDINLPIDANVTTTSVPLLTSLVSDISA